MPPLLKNGRYLSAVSGALKDPSFQRIYVIHQNMQIFWISQIFSHKGGVSGEYYVPKPMGRGTY